MTKKTTVIEEFKDYHKKTVYSKSDLFCPRCGHKSLWQGDDYYLDNYGGYEHVCTYCKAVSYHNDFYNKSNEVLEQLRSGVTIITNKPSIRDRQLVKKNNK